MNLLNIQEDAKKFQELVAKLSEGVKFLRAGEDRISELKDIAEAMHGVQAEMLRKVTGKMREHKNE